MLDSAGLGQHLQTTLSVYMSRDCTAAAVIQLIIQQCTSMCLSQSCRNIALARYSYVIAKTQSQCRSVQYACLMQV